jgi:hypothetical protein
MTLDNTGNLNLSDGNSIIRSLANSSLDPLYPNVSTMVLTPDSTLLGQSLVLDPTAPGHIHLRAPGPVIDQPFANIFLGGEESSFEVGYYNGAAPNVFVHSGNNTWTFDNSGNLTAPGVVDATSFTGDGSTLSNVAVKTSGSWTLASGVNTVSISVPLNGTYAIWINGNIPNGIATYTATAVVTNTNVPVLGSQYAWYYETGNALVFTSIPNQFVGTEGSISNASPYGGNTANVFTFGITNNSGSSQVVNYGYTTL